MTGPEEELGEKPKDLSTKLLDAGLLVLLATTVSLGTSSLYVFGLSSSLNFPIQSYFALQDYLQITAYWFGPVLGVSVSVAFMYTQHILDLFEAVKRDFGQMSFPSFLWRYRVYPLIAAVLCGVSFSVDWLLAFSAMIVVCATWIGHYSGQLLANALVGKTGNRSVMYYGIVLAMTIGTFAYALGYWWTPESLNSEKTSEIYILYLKGEVQPTPIKAKVLFSLTQYVISRRDDDVFIVLPVGRIERIETPKNPLLPMPSPPAKPVVTPSMTSTPSATTLTTASPKMSAPSPAAKATPPPTANLENRKVSPHR
jgi:hypothetical protein